MKILYYTQTNFLDCDLPLIRSLIKKGHDIYFLFELLPYHLSSNIINIRQQLPEVGLLPLNAYDEFHLFDKFVDVSKSFILNRPCKVYSWKNVKLRVEFYRFVRAVQPDVIHCTNFIDLPDFFLYFFKKKIVQIVHDPFLHSGENSFRTNLKRWVEYKVIKCFVLLNKSQQAEFISLHHLKSSYVYINRLGTYDYLNYFKKEPQEPTDKKTILFWGRISPYKGVEYLLEAMETVHKQIPNTQLVIAGSGKIYFDYSLYEGKGYIKLINRYITMEELGELLSSATVVVCPYTDATQSGVTMSAFTYQVPVIGTNVGGLPEMIDNGATGLLVPPRDSKSLAESLVGLLTSDATLKKFRNNIHDCCHKGKYSWDNIAAEYIKIYQRLLPNKGK